MNKRKTTLLILGTIVISVFFIAIITQGNLLSFLIPKNYTHKLTLEKIYLEELGTLTPTEMTFSINSDDNLTAIFRSPINKLKEPSVNQTSKKIVESEKTYLEEMLFSRLPPGPSRYIWSYIFDSNEPPLIFRASMTSIDDT